MKKYLSCLGASLVAIAALSSCNKELTDPNEGIKGGIPFEICASVAETRTTIDEAFKTTWVVEGTADQINLYHKEASAAEYVYDNAFSAQTVDGKFSGELTSALETGKEYQWLAKYPYDSYLTTPAKGYSYIGSRSDGTQSQEGLNNSAHLSGYYMPLVGKGTSLGTASPTIIMEHASSVLEINVANNTEETLDVTSITFTAPESIIGQFVIDYTGETTTYTEKTYASAVATLSVTDGAIAPGNSGKFYIAIKPFTVSSGVLKVAVNGYEKEITISNKTVFSAGKIKKINFNFDKVVVDYVTLPWTEDFSGDLSIYSLVNGETETKTYDAALAGGTAPELLVAKNNGSFSAKVKASVGDYVLTFKSNHADFLSISIDNEAITLTKVSDTEYSLSIPDGVDFFNVTFTNTTGSNSRLDDIALVSNNRTVLGTPKVTASLNNTDASVTNSIDVTWNAVKNAGSYVVKATPATGNAVSETVTAVESTTTYKHTFSGLAYETAYTFSVVAKPSDTSLYLDSAAGEAEPVTTGAKPAEAGVSWSRVTTVAELLAGGTFIIGYEATANSGEIVPMANTGSATTSAAGFIYSGSKAVSGGKDTIDMSTVSETSNYEVTIVASTSVSGAICIKLGDNYLGNTNTKNKCKLFTTEAATTAFTPTVGNNDVFTLKIAANKDYHTLQYNASSPRFAVYGGAQKNVVIYKKGN